MQIILPALAQRLKPLRQSHKLTQKQMAEFLKVTESYYQKIEYGKVNLPATTLMALAAYFRVSADYLLGLSDRP